MSDIQSAAEAAVRIRAYITYMYAQMAASLSAGDLIRCRIQEQIDRVEALAEVVEAPIRATEDECYDEQSRVYYDRHEQLAKALPSLEPYLIDRLATARMDPYKLSQLTDDDLLGIRGIGPGALTKIRKAQHREPSE